MNPSTSQLDTRMAKALSHPIRVRALEILNQRVASPSDIAKQLDLPVANVSYHVNTLLRLKCIEEVETRHVRGAIEHLYRATRRPTALLEDWKEMPVNAKNAMASEIGRVAFDDLRRALARESFGERSNEHFTFTRLVLDEEGWQEVYDILVETLDRVMAVHAQSAARLAEDGGERAALRSVLSMFHYESPAADNS